ncbi:MAG: restriction endonuclease [Rhodospirillales bacterium]|nr:restriction endonuclease [Rhodospirillales bacterium]
MADTVWGIHMADLDPSIPVELGFVGIGWHEMGDLSNLERTRDSFKLHYAEVYPDTAAGAIPVQAGVLYRFVCEIAVGDIIVFPSKPDRMVHLGRVVSDYKFDPSSVDSYPNRRNVEWLNQLPRANFSQSALYEIGSAITLFQISNNTEEFLAALTGEESSAHAVDATTVVGVSQQVEESTEDFVVKRLKTNITSYEFEEFVAHLLTCMGYHARATQASSDGGIDVIAHRDELGFEPPIIKVQCKQTLGQIGRPEVQRLHGAIEQGEHGLFVTLGGFSPDAKTFERSKPNLRLIDRDALVELIYTHYSRFNSRYKMVLPLKQTYIPGPSPGTVE